MVHDDPPAGTVWDPLAAQVGQQILAALCSGEHHRRSLTVVCSVGLNVLRQMSFNAEHDLPMLVLEGSGCFADIWTEVSPTRTSTTFDPVKHRQRLSASNGFEADTNSVNHLRTVLRRGEMMIHKIDNNSGALEQMTRVALDGDQVLQAAALRQEAYCQTAQSYQRPRKVFLCLSALISFISTVLALVIDVGQSSIKFQCQ